jgi:hypothetical protein
MARAPLTIQDLGLAGDTDVAFSSCTTDGLYIENDGTVLVSVKNDSGGALAVVADSVPNRNGREGDITLSVGAGKIGMFPLFKPELFNQSGSSSGRVHLNIADATSLTLAAVRIKK